MSSRSPSKKVLCSNLEWRDEVDADERMKRKAATRRDSKAAKRNKKAKKDYSKSSSDANATSTKAGKRKQNGKRSRSKGAVSKTSIKVVREQRRIQQTKIAKREEEEEARRRDRKSHLALDHHAGNLIAAAKDKDAVDADQEDFFWEVEAVIGRRIRRARVEYLIRWKGCAEDDNTWEPAANLCDSAMEEAMAYAKAQKLKEKQRAEDGKKLFGTDYDLTNAKNASGRDVSIEGEGNATFIGDGPNASNVGKSDDKMEVDSETCDVVDDYLWKWSDADQVVLPEVERIDVNAPNSANTVKEARINGTPLVLVGHVGWANFAKRWLTKKDKAVAKNDSKGFNTERNTTSKGGEADLISLNLTNVAANISEAMAAERKSKQGGQKDCLTSSNHEDTARKGDGRAIVRSVKDDYTAINISRESSGKEKPPAGEPLEDDKEIAPSFFKMNQEKNHRNDSPQDDLLDLSKLNYELDVKKMINDIGEEDVPVIKRNYNEEKPIHGKIAAEKFLTNCWPNTHPATQQPDKTRKIPKKSSNLYLHQWQFPLSDTAGRKLCHQNNPLPKGIMGEDLLRYWLDLPQCKLDSPLQYIFMGREDTLSKLHKDPGGLEISIAPIIGQKECVLVHRSDGSNCLYHLNASLEVVDLQRYPLLSQARGWRTIIQPGEILLMPHGTYHQCRNVTPCLSYSRFHLDTVNLLPFVQSLVNGDAPEIDHKEVLWNLTSELIKRVDGVFDDVQSRVKVGLDEGDLITGDIVETVNTLRTLRHFVREVARREEIRQLVKGCQESEALKNSEEHNFGLLVDDVDMCLHEFRFRLSKEIPPFKPRRGKVLKNTLARSSGRGVIRRDMSKFGIGSKPVVAFNTSLENNYMSLVNADIAKNFPTASKDKVGESLIEELVPGDKISVKLEQKHVKAEVIEILPPMKSAYLSFEDYPSIYDEYQPYEFIRLPTGAEIPPEDIKPGLVVIDLSNSNEYRAKIQSTMNGPMARAKLIVSQHEMIRLISPAMIFGRYVPPKRKPKQTQNASTKTTAMEKDEAPPVIRPSEVGQIVEVGRRGAARVIKVHGEQEPTHVDVTFILGNAHAEIMVPIEMVQLAPELDPKLGRGRRQVKKKSTSPDEDETKSNKKNSSKKNEALADGLVSPSTTASSDD